MCRLPFEAATSVLQSRADATCSVASARVEVAPEPPLGSNRLSALAGGRVAVLDPAALDRLRELDPSGASRLMERVVRAFNGSIDRLVPQLQAAQAAADWAGVRHVAHTLKSSSASVGAVKLSELCAEMELMARQGQSFGMDQQIATLCAEISAVSEALAKMLDRPL